MSQNRVLGVRFLGGGVGGRDAIVSSFQFPVSSFRFPVSSFRFPVSGFQLRWPGRSRATRRKGPPSESGGVPGTGSGGDRAGKRRRAKGERRKGAAEDIFTAPPHTRSRVTRAAGAHRKAGRPGRSRASKGVAQRERRNEEKETRCRGQPGVCRVAVRGGRRREKAQGERRKGAAEEARQEPGGQGRGPAGAGQRGERGLGHEERRDALALSRPTHAQWRQRGGRGVPGSGTGGNRGAQGRRGGSFGTPSRAGDSGRVGRSPAPGKPQATPAGNAVPRYSPCQAGFAPAPISGSTRSIWKNTRYRGPSRRSWSAG